MLADSYSVVKQNSRRHCYESDDTDNISVIMIVIFINFYSLTFDIMKKVIERPALSEISKYMPSSEPVRYRKMPPYYGSTPTYDTGNQSNELKPPNPIAILQQPNQYMTPLPVPKANTDLLQFIEKQEGYIEQLERESQFCRVNHFIFFCFHIYPTTNLSFLSQFEKINVPYTV